ncbi:hypothetical protein [Vitiosangium sp. GDMCC 1.1324]|uniref:hypothetical protein n=1 Tax=Vitiosangium sp. (strain GDMCC 1.1324) TaxID=2138576 RepID=UPI000D3CCAFB|nr:hypothetical protein [Vitiosangium sp. GDMCC 1.1324]PTL78387.1 hypothetical protein DAT35_38265 [Vitiosangium sp. GDMCC 1.1324]
MASRWDYLFETKPVPLIDHLLEEVAKLLAKDLQQWPPPVQELDLEVGGQYATLFTEPPPRPVRAVYDEALRLSRWELSRELDAYDDYMRNKRYLERGLAPTDRLALLFLNRWIVDQMLGLGEATEGRVNRRLMLQCLDRLEARQRLIQTTLS